ncbi:MAG: hypothetical protein N3B21_06260 [Clostridia bacterium]|nr:hypothetical protein [Clostridia bacterium]
MKVITKEDYPMYYAQIQYELGNVYSAMYDIKAEKEYIKKAIELYDKALEVFTKEEYPPTHEAVMEERVAAEKKIAKSQLIYVFAVTKQQKSVTLWTTDYPEFWGRRRNVIDFLY